MMQTLRRILTLIGKEFAMVMRDPKSRFVVIGPPLIQFFVFGYAATFDLTNVRYAVLDESHSSESRALLARFEGNGHFTLAQTLTSDQQIAGVINPESVQVFLHGAHLYDIWPQFWPMAIIAMVTLPVAGWMFRHRTG